MNYFYFIILLSLFFVIFYFLYFIRFNKSEFYIKKHIVNLSLFVSFFIALFGVFSYSFNFNVNIKGNSSDIVFLLDVSTSMDALDYNNKGIEISRLDVSKTFIKQFIITFPNNRYSLIIFAGDTVQVSPLTNDLNLFLNFLDNTDSKSIIRGGNDLGNGFLSSVSRFENENTGGGIIILSDFEFPNKDKNYIDKYLKELSIYKTDIDKKNIKSYLIGVGNKTGSYLLSGQDFFGNNVYRQDKFGKNVLTKFDEYVFNYFSNLFNSEKFELFDYNELEKIIFSIKNIPSRDIDLNKNSVNDYTRYIMILSYLFLLIYMFLSYTGLNIKLGKK